MDIQKAPENPETTEVYQPQPPPPPPLEVPETQPMEVPEKKTRKRRSTLSIKLNCSKMKIRKNWLTWSKKRREMTTH
jgi:hypothetical protein